MMTSTATSASATSSGSFARRRQTIYVLTIVLLFTARYPQSLFVLVVGIDRWSLRVAAYAGLMTDAYPPFRLDQGGTDPGSVPAGPAPAAPPVIPVSKPVTREVTDYIDFTGRTEAQNSVNVVPRVTGYLVSAPFKEGAEVKSGDLLFEIDPRPYQAQYDQAEGQVLLAEARVKEATADNLRAKALAKTPGAISQQDLDRYQAAEEEAIAAVQAAMT